jgi:hypothetical protein
MHACCDSQVDAWCPEPTRRSITYEAAAPTLMHEAIDGWTCIDPEPSVLSL